MWPHSSGTLREVSGWPEYRLWKNRSYELNIELLTTDCPCNIKISLDEINQLLFLMTFFANGDKLVRGTKFLRSSHRILKKSSKSCNYLHSFGMYNRKGKQEKGNIHLQLFIIYIKTVFKRILDSLKMGDRHINWRTFSFSFAFLSHPFLKQNYNLHVQGSTFFLTNGCRVDTNDLLSYVLRILNLQFKNADALL